MTTRRDSRHSIPPIGDGEERISFGSLARLVASNAPPAAPDHEEGAPTPASPSVPVPAGGPEARPRRARRPARTRVMLGVALGLSLGAGAGAVKSMIVEDREGLETAQVTTAEPRRARPGLPSGAVGASGVGGGATLGGAQGAPVEVQPPEALAPLQPVEERSAEPAPPEAPAARSRSTGPAPAAPLVGAEESAPAAPAATMEEAVAPQPPAVVAVDPAPADAARAPARPPSTLHGWMDRAVEDFAPEPLLGAAAAAPAEPVGPAEPSTPTRGQVTAAMESIRTAIVACAGGQHGLVQLEVTVGRSGRVRNALVSGHFAGSAEGSCMARTARTARFEPFEADTFTVRYPFRL